MIIVTSSGETRTKLVGEKDAKDWLLCTIGCFNNKMTTENKQLRSN